MVYYIKWDFPAPKPNWLKLPHPVPCRGELEEKGVAFIDIIDECIEEVNAAIIALQEHRVRLGMLSSEDSERMCYLADVPEGELFYFLTDGRDYVRGGADGSWCACVLAGENKDTNIRLVSPLTRVIPSATLRSSV